MCHFAAVDLYDRDFRYERHLIQILLGVMFGLGVILCCPVTMTDSESLHINAGGKIGGYK